MPVQGASTHQHPTVPVAPHIRLPQTCPGLPKRQAIARWTLWGIAQHPGSAFGLLLTGSHATLNRLTSSTDKPSTRSP